MQPALLNDQRLDDLVGELRKVMRAVAALRQAIEPARGVSFQVFVAGLSADPKLLAQLSDREPVALGLHDESSDLFHRGYFFPGHDAQSVTHHSGLSVTYHSGSDQILNFLAPRRTSCNL